MQIFLSEAVKEISFEKVTLNWVFNQSIIIKCILEWKTVQGYLRKLNNVRNNSVLKHFLIDKCLIIYRLRVVIRFLGIFQCQQSTW